MKKCPTCNLDLENKCFHVNRSRPDGLDWRCKSCKKFNASKISQSRRDARRYAKNPEKTMARLKAREAYGNVERNCAVLNCTKMGIELHHVTYKDALAVVPLCQEHHRMDHEPK